MEQFTYIASHDLKSPVQTILSFSQLIEKDLHQKSYDALFVKIDFIKTAAEQARRLITDILEFSRIQEGEKGEKEIVDFCHLVEKVQLNLMDLIQDKKGRISVKSCHPTLVGNQKCPSYFKTLLKMASNTMSLNILQYISNPTTKMDFKY